MLRQPALVHRQTGTPSDGLSTPPPNHRTLRR